MNTTISTPRSRAVRSSCVIDDVEDDRHHGEGQHDEQDRPLLLLLGGLELLGRDDLLPLPGRDDPDLRLVRVLAVRVGQDVLQLLLRAGSRPSPARACSCPSPGRRSGSCGASGSPPCGRPRPPRPARSPARGDGAGPRRRRSTGTAGSSPHASSSLRGEVSPVVPDGVPAPSSMWASRPSPHGSRVAVGSRWRPV